jgi:hypothetical protein
MLLIWQLCEYHARLIVWSQLEESKSCFATRISLSTKRVQHDVEKKVKTVTLNLSFGSF